jgi:hypothetical protein
MGLEPMTQPSILLLFKEEKSFELELNAQGSKFCSEMELNNSNVAMKNKRALYLYN